MNRMVGAVLLAALSISALAMAAATFDSVAPTAPGIADYDGPDTERDGGGGSPPEPGGADSSDSLSGLATPFEWRAGLAADGAGTGGGGLVVPLALAVLVVLVVLAVGVIALVTRAEPASEPDRSESGDAAAATTAPERRRRGVAADENAVYRSWRRLADRLDAPPTWSPADLAAAARDRGFDGRVVAELTATFREVRYGGRPATPEREARATDALDRLDGEDDA